MTLIETLENVLHKSNKVIIYNGKKAKELCPIFSFPEIGKRKPLLPQQQAREVTMAASPMHKSECPQVEL